MSGEAAAGGQGNTETAGAAAAAAATTAGAAATGSEAAKGGAPKAGEGTAGGDGKGGEAGKGGAASQDGAAAKQVPDSYTLTVPEEGKAYVDEGVATTYREIAKRSGWSQQDFDNAIGEHTAMLSAMDAQQLAALKADAELGGEKLAETQRLSKSAIDLIRPTGHPRREAFLREINKVAASNNPEFVAFLADIGRRAGEDGGGGTGGSGDGEGKSPTEVLFAGTTPK